MPTAAELKVELDADSTGRGYAAASDGDAAVLLNEVQVGLTVNRTSCFTQEIREAIEVADWISRTDAQRQALIFLTAGEALNPNHPNIAAAFSLIFASTATLGNLQARQTRDGSRAEQLWGDSTMIDHRHVAAARAI